MANNERPTAIAIQYETAAEQSVEVRKEAQDKRLGQMAERAAQLSESARNSKIMVDSHGVVMTARDVADFQSGDNPDARK